MKPISFIFTVHNFQGRTFSGQLDFADTNPEFKNIVLRPIPESDPKQEEFHVIVTKNLFDGGPDEINLILKEATREAEKFVCVFSVFSGVKLFGFDFIGYDVGGRFCKKDRKLKGSTAFGTLITTVNAPSVVELKLQMSAEYDLARLLMYHNSATLVDPIARFLSLYMVMLHECEDKQSLVDKAILKIDSKVAQFKMPNGKGYETVFTRLRNEMGHKRDGVNILETQDEIRRNVDRFEKIVKQHILG